MREILVNEIAPGHWWVQIIAPEGCEVRGPMTHDAARKIARDLEGEAS